MGRRVEPGLMMAVKPSMKHIRLTTLVISVFLAQAALAAKDYWVWKDDNGVTNFSEQKPKDHPARHITSGIAENPENWRRPGQTAPQTGPEDSPDTGAVANATGSGDSAGDNSVDKGAEADKAQNPDQLAEAQRKKIEQQVAAAKQQNCRKARSNMQILKTRPRIRLVGKDGKERVMSQDEVQQKIQAVQAIIDDNC